MAASGSSPQGDANTVVCCLKYVKGKVWEFFYLHPPSFSFIVSLFLIGITLNLIGIHIKDEHMPDLDAMKYWNAFVGKLGDNDFCFQLENKNDPWKTTRHISNTICNNTSGYKATCEVLHKEVTYGKVDVEQNFSLHRLFVEQAKSQNIGMFYSTFTGDAIGAQIKDSMNYCRIDSCIELEVWIPVFDLNLTSVCSHEVCHLQGCLKIKAPTDAVPTRMPHVHNNFTFAAQVLESKGRPQQCSCQNVLSTSFGILNISIIRDRKKCSTLDNFTIQLQHKNMKPAKGYAVISVELSKQDRLKAFQHMHIASLCVLLFGAALTIVVLFSPSSVPKINLA